MMGGPPLPRELITIPSGSLLMIPPTISFCLYSTTHYLSPGWRLFQAKSPCKIPYWFNIQLSFPLRRHFAFPCWFAGSIHNNSEWMYRGSAPSVTKYSDSMAIKAVHKYHTNATMGFRYLRTFLLCFFSSFIQNPVLSCCLLASPSYHGAHRS